MRRVALALVLLLGVAALTGCGKKGPLYLPDDDTAPAESSSSDTKPSVEEPF